MDAAHLRRVPGDRFRMHDVGDVEHLQPSVRTSGSRVLRSLGIRRRKDFVGDEHVVFVPPRRVRAANESGAAVDFNLFI